MPFNDLYIPSLMSTDDKPIILVLMNHAHEPRCVAAQRTWNDYPNIKFFVHVFFHETKAGLITCQQNDDAIHQIQQSLQAYFTNIVKDSYEAPTPCENPQMNQRFNDEYQSNPPACVDSKTGFFSKFPKLF